MSSKPEVLDSWATLRLAAAQVAEEDQLEGSMGLLQAADEVAALLDLPSPLRNKKHDRLNDTESSALDRTTHSLSLSESQVNTNLIHNDADHLLRSMNIEPKEISSLKPTAAHSVAFDDVNALLHMSDKSERGGLAEASDGGSGHDGHERMELRTQRSKTSTQRGREHYLQRLRGSRQSQTAASTHSGISRGAMSVSSQMSQLSRRLSRLSPDRLERLCQSDTQRQLLSAMYVLQSGSNADRQSSSADSRRHHDQSSRSRTETLSQPRSREALHRTERDQRFLLFEEAQECHFIPNHARREREKRRKEKADGYDSDDNSEARAKQQGDAFFAFLARQEGEERKRREEAKYEQKKLDYDARQNKRACPNCGALQTYDDVREKRKNCAACSIPYELPLSWGKVAKQFLRRTRDHQRRRDENLRSLAEEIVRQERGRKQSHQLVCDVELFLQRLADAADRRFQRLQRIEQEAYHELTFRPQTRRNREEKAAKTSDDELDDELVSVLSADPVRDFLLRYEEDMEDRRRRMPQKYRSKAEKPRSSEANYERQSGREETKQATAGSPPRFRF